MSADREALAARPIASCLICGHVAPLAIYHADHTDVGVCEGCRRAALREPLDAETLEPEAKEELADRVTRARAYVAVAFDSDEHDPDAYDFAEALLGLARLAGGDRG